MNNLRTNLTVAFCWLLIFSFGCSAAVPNTSATAKVDAINLFKSDDPSFLNAPDSGFMNTETTAATDESSLIVGVWRMSYRAAICQAQGEMIFQSNGTYSGYAICSDGTYPVHLTGNWQILSRGAMRLQYDKYRDSEGKLIHPAGETFYFRFLDRKRMQLADGTIAYRVG